MCRGEGSATKRRSLGEPPIGEGSAAAREQEVAPPASEREQGEHVPQPLRYEPSSYFPTILVVLAMLSLGRGELWILPLQVSVMLTIVYRSSASALMPKSRTPVANVLRCAVGTLVIDALHAAAASACGGAAALLAVHAVFAYAGAAVSDYAFHRFVWHAHWVERTKGLERWWWNPVRMHYVQHFVAHHKHSVDLEGRAALAAMRPVPRGKLEQVARRYSTMDEHLSLACTDHGITVLSTRCIAAFVLMHGALPLGTLALLQFVRGDVAGAVLQLAAVGIPAFLVVEHDKYHADTGAMRAYADESRWFGWLWRSGEMARITQEHKMHHHIGPGTHHIDGYYGLLPFNRFFVYPIWQDW